MPGEQVRKQPHHDFAVFQHVGHAGGRARIVLEHEEIFRLGPDDVDAGDMHIDVVRHVLAVHLGPEHRVLEDQVVGDDIGAQDVAAVIDVAQEHVERAHPLLQALFQQRPFLAGEDAGNDVEGDQPFLGFRVAIDGKGDADPAEQQFGFLAAIFQRVRRRLLEPAGEFLVGRAEVAAGPVHFVERNCHIPRLFLPDVLRDVFLGRATQCMTKRDGSKARASAICMGRTAFGTGERGVARKNS